MKKAFTMIELVFVIVILGILSAVAFPKLSGVLKDANYASALATVSSLRTAIVNERQSRLIKGNSSFPEILDDATKDVEHEKLFDGNGTISILQYPVYSKAKMGGWMKTTDNGDVTGYKYYINDATTVDFTYDNGTGVFDCNHSLSNCREISE